MKMFMGVMIMGCCLAGFVSLTNPLRSAIGIEPAIAYFKTQSGEFVTAATALQAAIRQIRKEDPQTIVTARAALKRCRQHYKRIAFFLEYFFKSAAIIYNGPPKYEVEEPYMEYQEPIGLQVIEGLLFESDIDAQKTALLQQAEAITSSAADLNALLYDFRADDRQLLESIRLELIRVITLDITGFDAPLLKSGIGEAEATLEALQQVLGPFIHTGAKQADSVTWYLASSLRFLRENRDFDSFDRLGFLTAHALPLQRQLNLLIKELQLEQNTTKGILNYDAPDIFSANAINVSAFPGAAGDNKPLAELGKKLFFEPALSGNHKISCATCHSPSRHFTEALPKSRAFDGHSNVKRNAASLLYAGMQFEQFWDGRSKSLEEQVRTVISSPVEMKGDTQAVVALLQNSPEYGKLFKPAFPGQQDSAITFDKVTDALAAFIRTLNPRNSPFDKYMQGDTAAMTGRQRRGFNLFMGKAQCGTCHFAPLFNGLTPPYYALSELEVLGTPGTDQLNKPVADTDNGRFDVFPIEFYEGAFKTPTVRNVSATAPYMHNGSFRSLETVMDFYNKGGGKGLGLKTENQTLSPMPLNLTPDEIGDMISFLHALEDSVTY